MHEEGLNNSHLQTILEVAEAIIAGDLDKEVTIDAEGIVAHLAGALNQIIKNLRLARPDLCAISSEAPRLVDATKGVAQLMHEATVSVLDNSDALLETFDRLEAAVCSGDGANSPCAEDIKKAKEHIFEIISSQSYQDKARQELEKLEEKLTMMRDALFKVLLVMNLQKGDTDAVANTKRLIEQVRNPETSASEPLKQDLVDELLAEFGL